MEALAALDALEEAISRCTKGDPNLERIYNRLRALTGFAGVLHFGHGVCVTSLPENLLVEILSHLSPRTLARVEQTCKALHGFRPPPSPVEAAVLERASRNLLKLPLRDVRPALSLQLYQAEARGCGLISAGSHHCCAVDARRGVVYTWGGDLRHALWQMDPRKGLWPAARDVHPAPDDLCAYLGHGSAALAHRPPEAISPKAVELPLRAGTKPIAVAAGRTHTLALSSSGEVYVWGRRADHGDNDWFLDDDEDADEAKLDARNALLGTCQRQSEPLPRLLPITGELRVVQISAGSAHSLLLTSTGRVYAYGMNSNGQLGTERRHQNSSGGCPDYRMTVTRVERIPGSVVVSQVSAGHTHSLALTLCGTVYSWGGVEREYERAPVTCAMCGHPESGWHQATSEDNTPYYIPPDEDGISSWECPEFFPRPITALAGQKAVQVSAGGGHSLVVCEGGSLLTFGYGDALGQGPAAGPAWKIRVVDTPTRVDALEGRVAQASAGPQTSFALTFDNQVYSCGDARLGGLGHTRDDPRWKDDQLSEAARTPGEDECKLSSFTLVTGLLQYSVVNVSVGNEHTMFLTRQGHVLVLGAHTDDYTNIAEEDSTTLFGDNLPDSTTNPELFSPTMVLHIQQRG